MENDNKKITTPTEKRTAVSGAKILINCVISLVVVLALILTSFFAFDGMRFKLADWAFWSQKFISGIATFVLMISIANIVEEIRGQKDRGLQGRYTALDEHYQKIMTNYETDDLGRFIGNINRANKYNAYIGKLKQQLQHARREKTIKKLHAKLLATPDEVWNSPDKVKYYKVTYNQLVSGAFDVSSKDSEYDLQTHKAKYGAQKFGWKMCMIVACGGIVGDLLYSYIDFTRDMVVPLVFKILTIFVAIYSGISFGYFLIERSKTVAKSKLLIFSKFRARVDNAELNPENRFEIAIEKDIVVEKIKAQQPPEPAPEPEKNLNPLQLTYEETFGSGVPVKLGAFAKQFGINIIKSKSDIT